MPGRSRRHEVWNVGGLVRHLLVQDLPNFTAAARGETTDWQAQTDDPGEGWAAAFREGARRLLDTWRQADLDQRVPMPGGGEAPLGSRASHQITELTVHGWDLARATGQTGELDTHLAEHALGWSRPMLRPEFLGPGNAFGLEVPVHGEAPAHDRLVGWFGRDPAWRPPDA